MEESLLNLAFLLLLIRSYDLGKDLKMEFIQLWVAMEMAAAMVFKYGEEIGMKRIGD
jgi:hypothetical protein